MPAPCMLSNDPIARLHRELEAELIRTEERLRRLMEERARLRLPRTPVTRVR